MRNSTGCSLHLTNYNSMELTSSAGWFAVVALLSLGAIFTKTAARRVTSDPRRLPPVVNVIALLGVVPTFILKGRQATLEYLYAKFGSVFTVSLFGLKVTFLIGPEVVAHLFQGSDSEVSYGNIYEFTVPMFGQAVGYGVDIATQNEQMRFSSDSMAPLNLRRKVEPMLQEIKDYFAKWGQEGIVDLKHELKHLLMLISSRILLGKEVREDFFTEFCQLFCDIQGSANMINLLFPYVPIPTNRQRDKARIKLTDILTKIVRSRNKMFDQVEDCDMLQKYTDSRYRDGRSTTEEEVAGLCLAVFFAANHTCSHAIAWTAAYLLSHEECLTAAIEEQNNITRKNKDHIDYNILSDMHYLHRCIKEALRMHPPVPVFLRKAHKSFTVRTKQGAEYDIPKDHILASPTILNHNMSYIYKNPQEYDPDRFSPERKEDKCGKFSYTSFGAGRHACFGESYAYMKFKMIWSYMLRNFEVELLSLFPVEDSRKFVPEPQGKIMVSYKRLPKT